jgi:3-deoxy-D-manno-octulosonic-acid transferase
MLASSRDGEKDHFLKQIMALAQSTRAQDAMNTIASANPQMLIVPRHPQRFDEVAALAGPACHA